jgi:hypothetical protein
MAKKIYVKSNYFYIVDTETDYIFEGLAKEVRVRRLLETSDEFYFDNVNGFTEKVPFADIQDENGDAYTDLATFVTFYESNTGNFNTPQAGGGSSKVTAFTCNVSSGSITDLVFQKNDHNLSISNFDDFDKYDGCIISKNNGWDIEKTILTGNCTGDDTTSAFPVGFNKLFSNNNELIFNKGFTISLNLTIKIEEF